MSIYMNNISFAYGKNKVLEDISLKFNWSEGILGIAGKNGSGKSTITKLVDCLLYPDSGDLYLFDKKINRKKNNSPIRANIGYLFQFAEDYFFLESLKDEIEYNYSNFGIEKIDWENKIYPLMNDFDLSLSFLNKPINTLSGGEKRKAALICVLALDPQIIILDEPTIGLDYITQCSLIRILKEYSRIGKQIIVISNDANFLLDICDKFVLIKDKKFFYNGTKHDLINNSELFFKANLSIPVRLDLINKLNSNLNTNFSMNTELTEIVEVLLERYSTRLVEI